MNTSPHPSSRVSLPSHTEENYISKPSSANDYNLQTEESSIDHPSILDLVDDALPLDNASLESAPDPIKPHQTPRPSRPTLRARNQNTQPPNSAFAIQYTALMLILFSFTAGAFSSPPRKEDRKQEEHKSSPPPAPAPLGVFPMPSLFSDASLSPDQSQLALIQQFVSKHDIQARLVLPFDANNPEQSITRLQLLVQRSDEMPPLPSQLSVEINEENTSTALLIVNSIPSP